MKSNEFISEEQLDEFSDTDPGIREFLTKKGYKFLGLGVDQSAYLEPGTGLVLKIFGTQDGYGATKNGKPKFTVEQKMFFIWAEYCMRHQNNPFLPKFYGFESFMFRNQPYLQIRQEKLTHNLQTGYKMADLASVIIMNRKLLTTSPKKTLETLADPLKNPYTTGPEKWTKFVNKIGGEHNLQILSRTIIDLYSISRKKRWSWDLHEKNSMVRSNGFPVIVDPWIVNNW